jgi:hypothetical protein
MCKRSTHTDTHTDTHRHTDTHNLHVETRKIRVQLDQPLLEQEAAGLINGGVVQSRASDVLQQGLRPPTNAVCSHLRQAVLEEQDTENGHTQQQKGVELLTNPTRKTETDTNDLKL